MILQLVAVEQSGGYSNDTFNYTVSDTDGDTDIAVLTITINGTNEVPTASDDYTLLMLEDGYLQNDANGVILTMLIWKVTLLL